MIDQATIDRILDAAQIVDVVSEFVTLKKRGVNYVGLCPFHDDKTPSFSVSPAKGLCKCFACGKGGNAVHFIMEHEQLSYPEALRRIENEVEEIKQHLHNEGSYELEEIGILTTNEHGDLIFEPFEAGILTPELYGLSAPTIHYEISEGHICCWVCG